MKILTVCLGGQVRSVALASALAARGHETRARGVVSTPAGTVLTEADCDWADLILPVEPRELPLGPENHRAAWSESIVWQERFAARRRIANIGPDVWWTAEHPDLRLKVSAVLAVLGEL